MATFYEEGLYKVQIQAANITKAKSGNDQIELDLTLLGYFRDTQGGTKRLEPAKTTSRFPPRIYLTITEKTMGNAQSPGWVAQTLQFMGFDGDFNNIHQLSNWAGEALNLHKENLQGDLVDNWNISRPAGDRTVEKADKKELRALNTRYGKFFKVNGTPKPKQEEPPKEQPQEQLQPAGQSQSDDIPF